MATRRSRRRDPMRDVITLALLGSVIGALVFPSLLSPDTFKNFGIILAGIVVVAGGVILGVMYLLKKKRQAAFLALELVDTDNMTGREFERFMAGVFKQRGYRVKETRVTGDYGVDLLIKKAGATTAVQLKRYQGKVGLKAVQEAVAGMQYYRSHQAMVVTNSNFTAAAHNLAQANKCELIGRNQLAAWILEYKQPPC